MPTRDDDRWTAESARRRARMVETDLAARGIRDEAVLDAMRRVPREAFVSNSLGAEAYDDRPLPIEARQTISQPYIVALTLEAAAIAKGDRVLDVGAGSGYASAVASLLAGKVTAIERHEELAGLARERLRRLGYGNVEVHCADGTLGWPADAPFDAIVVGAGGPKVPEPLKMQLAIGGRLVMPVGAGTWAQDLVRVVRRGDDDWSIESLCAVRFVPLIGAQGWADDGR